MFETKLHDTVANYELSYCVSYRILTENFLR
jgi:hypothetical protein